MHTRPCIRTATMVYSLRYTVTMYTVLLVSLAWNVTAEDNAPAVDPPPPVGFVTHFHLGDFAALGDSPVTAELADLIHWRVNERHENEGGPDSFLLDFSNAAQWLPLLNESRRRGFPIIDTAIHHSRIPWRQEMTRRAGENLVGYDAKVWDFSSLHSPVFRDSVFSYIEQFTTWFKQHDTQGHVPGYVNGAEWFYPGTLDYSPLALDAYRAWLEARYTSLDAVNHAWGADFDTWRAVTPPRFAIVGGVHANEPTFTLDDGVDASFRSKKLPVSGGRAFKVSARVEGAGVAAALSGLHIAWFDDAGAMVRLDAVQALEVERGTYNTTGIVEAPMSATTVEFHCKLFAPGHITFIAPSMTDKETGARITSMQPTDWEHYQYVGTSAAQTDRTDNGLRLTLTADVAPLRFEHPAVALEDWVTFSYEAMAAWLNECAQEIKRQDPERLVVSYVGFVFAQQAQWDYAMLNQRLDISLSNTSAIDINGIQMCIAADDYSWATHIVDTARKYDKPVWATDLIDFPYGLYSGFEAIYRGTLACVQHGMSGVFWYGWKGVPDYAFLERMATVDRDRLIRDTSAAIDAVAGYDPYVSMAQLMPMMSYSTADADGRKGDMIDNGGLYRLLLDMGVTPDIWTPYELERSDAGTLDRYGAVFLSDCPVLPRPVYEHLLRYVQSGGILISSGRLPTADLAGDSFHRPLAACEGVFSLDAAVGRAYWGKLRRDQVYGNTPPVLVEAPDPDRTPANRRALRDQVSRALAKAAVKTPVRLVSDTGDVHLTPFYNAATDAWLLFLVHKGHGRCHHVDIRIDLDREFTHADAWCDFDVHHLISPNDEGLWRTPDFAHACIITLTP